MSKMKLALDVVEDLRSLANSLETLANAATGDAPDQPAPTQAAPTTQPAATEQPIATAQPTPAEFKLTLVELRAFVAERSTPENRAKIKAILGKFGVSKLTELPEERYEALKSEVEKL
jgi:hypothetical protein